MLGKLLKHEFEALIRYYAIIGIVMGAVTLFYKGYLMLNLTGRSDFFIFLNLFAGTAYGAAMIGCLFASLAVIVMRFYKNLVTDEGYLTFTLPVSAGQIIVSKLIAAISMYLLTGLAGVLSVLVLRKNVRMIDEIIKILTEEFTRMTKDSTMAVFLIYMVTALIYSLLVFYTAIALGQTCRNHKVLYSVLYYFVIYMITQFVIGMIFIITFFAKCHTLDSITDVTAGIMAQVFLVCSAGLMILGIGCFSLTDYLFQKKLNLE